MARAATGPRFTFFGGKGGVGKTTCAAAAAVRAANEGSRVLVVSTDPAHSLADALDLDLGPEPRRVVSARQLFAAELDADRALTRWLKRHEEAIFTIAERGTYLDEEDIDRLLALSFPGVDELVGLVELLRLSRTQPFDHVVVDTAPTGHTLRLLEMPETLARIGQVLDDMHAKHRFLASSLGGVFRPDFADEAIAEIEEEARSLRSLLSDRARASFTWVTLPEELPARESERGVAGITELGIHVDVVVVNRVWPAPSQPCRLCTPRTNDERIWRQHLRDRFRDRRVVEVPAQIIEPRGVQKLMALAMTVRAPAPLGGASRGASFEPHARAEATPLIAPSVRLLLFGGKGGVGKTTAAAASALHLAEQRGRSRILVLSTDPAHSLGDAFGTELTDEARPIPRGPRNLFARELDAKHAWEVERENYRKGIDDLFSSIFSGRMDATFDRAVLEDLLDLAPPGIDELFAIVAILDALLPGAQPSKRKGAFDLVIVDTAPTGHTLRLLALPEKALSWVHAIMAVILKYRSVVGLGEFASDLTQLAKRLRALIELLSDPAESAFLIVSRPSALPRLETERLARALRRLHIPIAAVVANGVTFPSCEWCSAAAEIEASELDRLDRLAVKFARARRLVLAPAVYPSPRGAEALRAWRGLWGSRERDPKRIS